MALRHLRRTLTTTATTTNKLPILQTTTTTTPSPDDVTLQLLSWGRGSSGQLGTGNEQSQLYPSPISTLLVPQNSYITSPPSTCQNDKGLMEIGVVCGLFHSGVVVDGKMWVWGKGDGGRLGFGDEETVFRPKVNDSVGKGGVRRLALGGLHSVAVDSLGDVYTWGYGGFGALGHKVYTRELSPKRVEGSWECRISEIATSGTHTAAVTEAGQLYTWGRDEGEGRLGLGPSRGPNEVGGLSIPTKVKALEVPVVSVACGGFFTTVITNDGKLWSWGANSNYELGRGNRVGGWKPQPIPSLEGVSIVQIASGGYHSLALTEDDGRVLSWGYGGHGQLGHFSTHNQAAPTVIESLASEKVVYIACGGSSSAAVTDTGKLYMWGNAKDGQLGVPGVPEIQPFPIEVKFLRDDDGLGSHNVLSVAIGASHALCLVSRSSDSPSPTSDTK